MNRLSDRKFGLMFATVFFLVFGVAWSVFDVRLDWAWAVAIVFLVVAIVYPVLLLPFNRIWEIFARTLGLFNNYLLLGIFFGLILTPVGLLMRAFGRDPMHRATGHVVRTRIHDAQKADIWVKDQYYNPHESWHSIGEVMAWFRENDVDYLNCSPPVLGTDGEEAQELFAPTSPGNSYQRLVTQLSWLGTIAREGALFDIIGRKNG